MSRSSGQRVDIAADEIRFAILQYDVAVDELDFAGAQRFDFPAFEHDAGFEPVTDDVIVGGLFVADDGGAVLLGGGFLFSHEFCWVRL